MSARTQLLNLARIIADECDQNAPLRAKIEACFASTPRKRPVSEAVRSVRPHRRTPAILNPLEVVRTSPIQLREQLSDLDIERLKDIVAEFGMDPSKLVMKWKEANRIIDHIVETSVSRASKGTAFRE